MRWSVCYQDILPVGCCYCLWMGHEGLTVYLPANYGPDLVLTMQFDGSDNLR